MSVYNSVASDKALNGISIDNRELEELVRICSTDPNCARLLRFLTDNPKTLMTASDISACLEMSTEEVHAALGTLDANGLVRQTSAGSFTFYGLVEGGKKQNLAQQFRAWCKEQRNVWEALKSFVA